MMGKAVNKLSKAQKNVPAKSQTRISAFFGRASAVQAPLAPASPTTGLRSAAAPAGRSPRKGPALIDVTGDTVSPNVTPALRPPAAAPSQAKTPPSVIELDDSCDFIPSSGAWRDRGTRKENRLTAIVGRTAELGSGAGNGNGGAVFGASETATGGVQLVQRLSKRPARSLPGSSPDRKRPTGPTGVSTELERNSPYKKGGWRRSPRKLESRPLGRTSLPRVSPRKVNGCLGGGVWSKAGREAVVLDVEHALSAGEAAAGLETTSPSVIDQGAGKRTEADQQRNADPVLPRVRSRPPPSLGPAAGATDDGASKTTALADKEAICGAPGPMAAVPPQERRPPRTPEPEVSELLFESMADDLFSSPFKEEAAHSFEVAAPAPLLRADDSSVPAWQRFDRYSVSLVERPPDGSTVLSLRAAQAGQQDRTVTLRGSWATTEVHPGDTVHVLSAPSDVIDNLAGQLVVSPDRLISGTSVVSAVFCARKAVLSEMFRGLEPPNKAMMVGTLVHQLFQEVISNRLCTTAAIRSRLADLLRQSSAVSAAYGGQLSSAELKDELEQFVAPILAWVRRYAEWGRDAEVATPIAGTVATPAPRSGEMWDGRVTELKDIEENYWSPRLGVKGKIDLTVEVKCRKRAPQVLPLELKTGRPSFSAEHQGQVTLYSMMTSERRPDPGAGLLLYLRTGEMREISAGQHQQRDLLQLRNRLVRHLSAAPAAAAPAAAAEELQLPPLPEVIANERACQRCPHLVACAAYQRPGDPPHAVASPTGHLSSSHLSYFLHWSLLLRLESHHASLRASMARLWTLPASERQARGLALAGCTVGAVRRGRAGWLHRLRRPRQGALQVAEGELVMVGTEHRLALCMGTLLEIGDKEVEVLLDRDLTAYPGGAEQLYTIDKCEYQPETSTGTYLSSLARLLQDTEHSRRLRELIIDRRPPTFLPGLGRLVITKCRTILRPLNKLQQRALLRVMMAEDYLLIQGMPGTGKTTTIVALVRLLVTMGRSVLLASYTHSAVDTVLLKLKGKFTEFVRLGRASRVHPDLRPFCAETMTESLNTPEQMQQFYDSKPVVATTCLGTNHPVFQRRKFDICIIDEASQIVQPAAIAPLLSADRFVLVGDPQQLPPVIQSPAARRRGMDRCLFSRLAAEDNTVQLTLQYRMNRALTAAANHLTYEGRLQCGSEAVDDATVQQVESKPGDPVWLSAALDPTMTRSLVLLDTSELDWRHSADTHGAVTNAAEAALVAHIAAEMVQRGISCEEVGVMAPYRGQVRLLRAALPAALEVNTVDQYQGRDKAVILYSCTRTAARRADGTADEETESADILSDQRRLTVAVTRAKHKLVLVGRRDTLATYPPFCRLLAHIGRESTVRLTAQQVSWLPAAGAHRAGQYGQTDRPAGQLAAAGGLRVS